MNGSGGPTPGYMAAVQSALQGPAPAPVTFAPDTITRNGVSPAPVPYGSEPPPTAAQLGFAPKMAPPPGPDMFGSQADASMAAFNKGVAAEAPPPPPPRIAGLVAPPSAGPADRPFPLVRMGGGGVANLPAKETELRGPHLQEQQGRRNEAIAGAIDAVRERSEHTASQEFAMAYQNEVKAQAREEAVNYAAAERNEELAQRQADFDQSVKAMSAMQNQPDYWASKSTPQKFGMLVGLVLGGFLQGKRGGNNPAMDMLNMDINRELQQQEMRYKMASGTVQAKQTAFGLAMEKYKNEDAARAAARAAMLDGVQAQMAQQAALWKGTDAQNRATMALAALEDEKMAQIAAGIQFTPARQVAMGPTFVDPRTGLTYNEAQAREMAKEIRGQEHDMDKGAQGIAGKLLEEGAKADAAKPAQMVRLHTGEVVRAPSDTEAGKLRDISAGVQNAQGLVKEAQEIRAGKAWMVPGTKEHARLQTIQSELTLAFKDRGGLGALSGPDMGLASSATGDITSIRPGTDEKLKAFGEHTNKALRSRVGTYANASPSARGEMPSSFTPHGSK